MTGRANAILRLGIAFWIALSPWAMALPFPPGSLPIDPGSESSSILHVARLPRDSSASLLVTGGYAYVAGHTTGFYVADVRDPAHPVLSGQVLNMLADDVALLEAAGKTVAALAPGVETFMRFVDVSDPVHPELLAVLNVGVVVHNVAHVPGTPYLYDAVGGGDMGGIPIVDASDPSSPVVVARWEDPAFGTCHDITIDPVRPTRAYCAGGNVALTLDVTNPLAPRVVAAFRNPLAKFHHTLVPTPDGSLLILIDESPGAQYVEDPLNVGREVPATPGKGTLWFYDNTDERNPTLLGFVAPPMVVPNNGPYTAHNIAFLPGESRLVAAWYGAGLQLVDYADPTRPEILDRYLADANPWDVVYQDGFVFTGDVDNGLDVFRIPLGG